MSEKAKETINKLNLFGRCYLAAGEIDPDNGIIKDLNDKFLMDILNREYHRSHYNMIDEDYIGFKRWFLEKEIKEEIAYETVILKLPNDYWIYGKPHKLKSPNKIYEWYDLSSKPYIKVDIPYEKITISSKIKGSPITIEDILFATTAMCLDQSRYVVDIEQEGFKLISRLGDGLLVLEPGIENIEH